MKTIASFAAALLFVNTCAHAKPPFPSELDAAAVIQDGLDDISTRAFPVGNGDLNALLWQRDSALCLRVTKNDLWDARIDTSQDPPLLKMDVARGTWSGGTDKVPSWNKFPYPQPRAAAVVRIGSAESATSFLPARLDLRRAVVEAGPVSVRVLAGRNVILIDGPAPVALEEIAAPSLPPASMGETDGVRWLRMRMPGDLDYPGMEYALAVASRDDRHAVAMVTSFDVSGPVLDAALTLARESLAGDPLPAHEATWDAFWSASGLRLGDEFFQQAWYRNLYYMRCFSRPGTSMPVTLYAGLSTDKPGWHGAPTLNYNFQQVFWPMLATNHVELMEPYVRFLNNFAPRGRWLARETYGVDGLFFPLNIFGPEHLVAPSEAKSRNARQIAYVPWTYTLGCTGFALQNVWLRYKYAPDRAYLDSVYPLLRDGAEFYANILELRADAAIGPSYNPEQGPFGSYNNPVDLAYFRFLFGAASEAAGILSRDAALVGRWQKQLARVPAYETTSHESGTIIANWKGADAGSVPLHNVASPTVPIFPADEITWFTASEQRDLFERTLRWLKHRDENAHIMVNVARARLSMPEAYEKSRSHFTRLLTPNGLFAKWPGHGSYLSESWAFTGLVAELLMQSVGDIVRVFPAWPKEHDASFTRLRAQGGFLVDAELKSGVVTLLEIEATVGGKLRVLNPWTGRVDSFETESGQRIKLTP